MKKSLNITTTCTRDCPNACGLVAAVEDGVLVRLTGSKEHPLTRGLSCHKTAKYVKRIYSPERIIHPMQRIGSEWHQISWDTALDIIAEKIKTICAEDGPEAILYYQGYGERTALKLLNKYFFNLLGGVTTLRGSLCGGTGQASQNMDFGRRISHDPLDHIHSEAMVLWARNPASTNISLVPIIKDIRKKGGRVITIDPFKNRSAALADRHIAPEPGKDVYLAMAAAKIILAENKQDNDFLGKYSQGFDSFNELLEAYSVEELCTLAGVSEDDAEYLAETLIRFKPTSILLGWGLHRNKNAHHSIRAIDALGAIAGIIGVEGGGVSQGFEEYGPYDQQYWGDELNPPRRTLLIPIIGEEILQAQNPKVRMIFSTASNPVCMAPNSTKVAEAFRQTEFKVYSGHFMDDTADLADIFLPATIFLEEDDVVASYGHNYVGPVNKAIEPQGECLSDFHMFSRLAERFDFREQFCRSAEEWLYDICSPIREWGGTMEGLRKEPFRVPEPMAPYLDKQFPTPSGKFEFMKDFDPADLGSRLAEYPYKLLTVAAHSFICSERTMAEHTDYAEILMNSDEASVHGIEDGDKIRVKSAYGEIFARIKTDATMRRDCVIAERGGWIKAGQGLNVLTQDLVSTVGSGTPYYETVVMVFRCEDEAR